LPSITNSRKEQNDSFENILESIGKDGTLNIESIERLAKIFSIAQITKVKEILSEIVKVVFMPSHREIWMKLGTDKDYIIYPREYCSCMDFFLQGTLKNRKYFCKHLIAQGIVEEISKVRSTDVTLFEKDENFKKKVTHNIEYEHFLN
jgi:predicted nucleic acid-binding Zn finger protein